MPFPQVPRWVIETILGDPLHDGILPLLLNFSRMPLKGAREALVRKKAEIRDKEVCASKEDSEILNWAPREVLKLVFLKELTEGFKNITDFHLSVVVLECCTKRNVMGWPGDPSESSCLAWHWVRPYLELGIMSILYKRILTENKVSP